MHNREPMPGPMRAPLVDDDVRERIRLSLGETMAVEAAAGTGKTTVLVDRIASVVASDAVGTTIDRIVAVTFTEKAAGDLKLRLRTRLEQLRNDERRGEGASASTPRLDAALANLEQAHVSTIHGFCAELLRERPVEAGVDPRFRTLTERESEALYRGVFETWLQRTLDNPPEGVRRAIRRRGRAFAGESPADRLLGAGLTLVEWRDFQEPWRREPFDREPLVDALVDELLAFVELSAKPADFQDKLFESVQAAHRLARDITLAERVHARDYDGLEGRLVDLSKDYNFRKPRTGHRNAPYRRGLLRAHVVEAHGRLLERLQTFAAAADADLAARLRDELQEPLSGYHEAKGRSGALDFLDLLVLARSLVRDHDEVRRAFQARFTHIFVDEFQDTDPLQAQLLMLLSSSDPAERDWRRVVPVPGKLFIVGDPKQSIYRFRRADVAIYQEVREQLRRAGAYCPSLTTNFRSTPAIQRFVNAAFAPAICGDPEALQAEYVPLSPVRPDVASQPAVVVLPVPRPFGAYGRVTKPAISGSLPGAVGAFVQWLVDESGWTVTERNDPERRIPIAPRHVCLLFRRFDSWGTDVTWPYVEALEARGIAHLLVGGKSFHAREEVEMLRTALTAIEWPDDELSVFGALHGGLFGVNDELLFEYRNAVGRIHPFRPVQAGRPERFAPITGALDVLRELHVRRNTRSIAETLTRLLDATRAHVALALRHSGEQALANVHHLVELARQHEASGGLSFRGFVEELWEEAERTGTSEAPVVEEGSDGVRLMTTHKAKGLEFPVVILVDPACDLSRGSASRWVDHRAERSAISLTGWTPLEVHEHEQQEVARDRAEGVRVAYVAATRARDLLVVPAVGDGERPDGWLDPLERAIFPAEDVRRDAGPAPGCPPFGADSVLRDDGVSIPLRNVRPGLHRLVGPDGSSYELTWWDPSVLDLDRSAGYGIRREVLIAKNASARAIAQGLKEYEAWRNEKERNVEAASAPSRRVLTVRARAAQDVVSNAADNVRIETVGSRGEHRPRGPRFGALVHLALSTVPLDSHADLIRGVVDQHARALGATDADREAAVQTVGDALRHPIFKRARHGSVRGAVRRETPVAILDDDGVLVEGVVDLAFEEDGTWTVVDFKTDEPEGDVLEVYRRQVALYARAVGRATGRPAEGVVLLV
jgi:ATP-dependent helicase/nuclease subunit A